MEEDGCVRIKVRGHGRTGLSTTTVLTHEAFGVAGASIKPEGNQQKQGV